MNVQPTFLKLKIKMEVVLPIGSELSVGIHLTRTEEKSNDFLEDNFLEVEV